MRLLILPAIALTGALVAVVPAIDLAAAPPNQPKDIKVVVTFPVDETNNNIQSDGLREYRDGVGGVIAYISGSNNGSLIFNTNAFNQAGRTLRFFFDVCVAGCGHLWNPLDDKAGLQANALRGGVVPTGGLMAMTTTEGELSAWVKFNIPVDSDPAYYNVCFDPRLAAGPCGAASSVASTYARIRREASNRWTISAITADNGNLIKDSQTKKNRFSTLGTYSMPFSFTVTCVNSSECP